MRSKLRKGYAAIAVMAIAVALLIVSMTAPVVSSSADFSIFNSGWNGTSDLAVLTYRLGKFVPSFTVQSSGTDITIEQLALTSAELDPATSALVIIGPTKTFTASEGTLVGDFVRAGGKLLLADDFGTGNSLLVKMGATSRFSGDLVMDLAYEKQPEFSVMFDLAEDTVTRNVSTVLLNYPSSLIVSSSTTDTLASSSIASWLDTNGNRLQEWGEPRGPYPMLAREHLGSGTILLLSDPSALINGMRNNMDNAVLADNLIDDVCKDRTAVYFDESHRSFFDPVSITMEFTGKVSDNAKAALAVVALVLTLWISTDLVDRAIAWTVKNARKAIATVLGLLPLGMFRPKAVEKPEPMTSEQLVAEMTEKHPEWSVGLMRYLLRERERHGKLLQQK